MITQENVGKVIEILGYIIDQEKPYLRMKNIKFECPSCGSVMSVLQEGKKRREPKMCSCGRKTGFKIISHEDTDCQEVMFMLKDRSFSYKVYLEDKALIEKLDKESCGGDLILTLKGEVQVEIYPGSNVGVFVIYAKELIK